MARRKNPKYKKQDLIQKIVEMSCNGENQQVIFDWLKTEGQISQSACYKFMKEAKPIINETLSELYKDDLDRSIRELEREAQEAKNNEEYRLAFDIRKQIHKLKGIDTQSIDITSKGDKINQIEVIKIIEVKNEDDEDIETKGEV
jgi:excinuclease UvrABC nuclease subunit